MASHSPQNVSPRINFSEFSFFKLNGGWTPIREKGIIKTLESAFSQQRSVIKFSVDSIVLEARFDEQIIINHSNLECYSLAWKIHGPEIESIPSSPKWFRAPILKKLEAFRPILEDISPTSREFAFVANKYNRSIPVISTVLKLKTPLLEQRFVFEAESMRETRHMMDASKNDANVRYGWHGTSIDAIKGILETGFRVSYPATNGRSFGNGVYFASENKVKKSIGYAPPDSNGQRHLLLCRLICGNIEFIPRGRHTMFEPSSPNYDSGIDNLFDPKIHVIWGHHTKRIFIEYIVTLGV